MTVILRKWGNSLGLRIPVKETTRLGWKEGSKLLEVLGVIRQLLGVR